MSDNNTKKHRRETMISVKSETDTLVSKVTTELSSQGISLKKNVEDLPGKPDIAFKNLKLVIFIDSCFWHGCKLHCEIPSTNTVFWHDRIKRNQKKDEEINDYYINNGWIVIRIWEHDINNKFEETIDNILTTIEELKNNT